MVINIHKLDNSEIKPIYSKITFGDFPGENPFFYLPLFPLSFKNIDENIH